MEIRVLGPFEVLGEGGPLPLGRGKQRALLALLALECGRTLSVRRIVDELWGELAPETAPKMVQIAVSMLRKSLPAGVLETRDPGYRLAVERDQVDVFRCEAFLRAGREALPADPEAASGLLQQAVACWRGPALAEFGEPFALADAPRLEELHLACLEERAEAELACGRGGAVAGELEALVARHPLRERLRGLLMRALYAAGRQADALSTYQDARRLLNEELGVEPSPALRELERRVLQHDPSLAPVGAAPHRPAPPAEPAVAPAAPAAGALVGRARELARLRAALEDARHGRTRVVLVAGEAGAGKTRLVETALEGAEAQLGVRVARGRCDEQHGGSEAYMPLLQALDRLCRGADGPEVVRVVAERAPSWLLQLPWLVPAAELQLLRERVLGAAGDRMHREGIETLLALAAIRPLVLVLEDVHWSDPSTIDLLVGLARREEPCGLVVLATYRPDDAAATGHPIRRAGEELAARGLAEELIPCPLDPAAVAEYLASRAPGLEREHGLAAALAERTAGHPLFVEKVVDAWLDGGQIERNDSGWRVASGATDLVRAIPTSVRALIRHRLMALGPIDRSLLDAASVAGRAFAVPQLVEVSGLDADDAEQRCARLAGSPGVLVDAGVVRWPDGTVGGRYAFAHDLWQDVLYDDLSPGRRVRLHGALGDRLERAYGAHAGDVASELAAHFVRARDPARAVVYLRRSAAQVLERRAPREAIELLSTALELLPGMEPAAERERLELDLQFMLGTASVATLGWAAPEAERAFVRARDLAEKLDRRAELARSVFRLAFLYEITGAYEQSEALLRDDLAREDRPRGAQPLIDAYDLLACSLFHQGAFEPALRTAEQGLATDSGDWDRAAYAAFGDLPGLACHSWAGLALSFLGQHERARSRLRETVELTEAPERRHGLAKALALAAMAAAARRDVAEAEELSARAIEVCTAGGRSYPLGVALVVHGWTGGLQGDGEPAIERMRRGIEIARATGALMDDSFLVTLLADALAASGRHVEALDAVAEAHRAVPRGGRYFYQAELVRIEGDLRLSLGDVSAAEAALRRALDIARAQGSPTLSLRASVSLARLLQRTRREPEARALLAGAYGAFDEGLDEPELRGAAAMLAELGAPSGEARLAPARQ